MAGFSSADAAIFLRDGKAATSAAGAGKVHLDFPEEVEQFGTVSRPGVVAGHPRMTFKTDDFPTLANGTTVTIAGVAYKVQGAPRQVDDGVLSVADLRKA